VWVLILLCSVYCYYEVECGVRYICTHRLVLMFDILMKILPDDGQPRPKAVAIYTTH
jgi:hypothetical protein